MSWQTAEADATQLQPNGGRTGKCRPLHSGCQNSSHTLWFHASTYRQCRLADIVPSLLDVFNRLRRGSHIPFAYHFSPLVLIASGIPRYFLGVCRRRAMRGQSVCSSVNEIACHAIPDDRPLQDGDLVSFDVSVFLAVSLKIRINSLLSLSMSDE